MKEEGDASCRVSRRSSWKTIITEEHKRARWYISRSTEEMSKASLQVIEPLKQEEPLLCQHIGRWYPEKYNDRGKCHFRAAHNVDPGAAKALHQKKVKWDDVQGVMSKVDRSRKTGGSDVTMGHTYFVGEHWVSLHSVNPWQAQCHVLRQCSFPRSLRF